MAGIKWRLLPDCPVAYSRVCILDLECRKADSSDRLLISFPMEAQFLVWCSAQPTLAIREHKRRRFYVKSRGGCFACKQRRIKVSTAGMAFDVHMECRD